MKHTGMILIAIITLSGCSQRYTFSAPGGAHYSKPGSTKQQSHKDNYTCRREATPKPNRNSSPHRRLDYNKYHNCLRARGYTKTKD
jgi:hypothetical protein